jgi:hypothetical protein
VAALSVRPAGFRLGQADDEQQPHQVGQQQVDDLQPHRGQQNDIGGARRQLNQQESAQGG